ncbi:heme-binding protein [Paracoccus sp. 1_MG-2023]|uniref:GlcG/HbpS family heme-binding protein n=1 Tax=unclassified Paracoccus (in: a-proteobacteria) TaxID=2688777 RepID=UPI001C0877AA|nr:MULTISPECIES: heme-binding protein [unclassified Paracoccus (in: a-proteobacteria)]MBU2956074.1 heme-binding protein [Paracoccus sp. C2R09]MDO6669480.1 heme-binding protein [Paracoccus sp. 1_MG-2023]
MKTVTRLDLNDARALIAGAAAHAEKIGVPMCIAITDDSGHLIAFERMEGGKITSGIIAIDKSFTASAGKKATHDIGTACQPGAAAYGINTSIGGRLMVVGGGLPVMHDGQVVGGIGVSSGTPAQDREVAQAGIDAWAAWA